MGCIVLGPGGVAGVMGAVGSSGPPRSSIVLVAGRIASERETLFSLLSPFPLHHAGGAGGTVVSPSHRDREGHGFESHWSPQQ